MNIQIKQWQFYCSENEGTPDQLSKTCPNYLISAQIIQHLSKLPNTKFLKKPPQICLNYQTKILNLPYRIDICRNCLTLLHHQLLSSIATLSSSTGSSASARSCWRAMRKCLSIMVWVRGGSGHTGNSLWGVLSKTHLYVPLSLVFRFFVRSHRPALIHFYPSARRGIVF